MNSFTQGPYSADGQFIVAPDPTGVHDDIYIAEIVIDDEDDRCVTDPKVQLANGKLLAAAPEMFEVLSELLDHYTSPVNSGDCGSWDPGTEEIIQRVRDALASATGGDS